MCLYLVILITYISQITCKETDKSVTESISLAKAVNNERNSVSKSRVKRSPQNFILGDRLVTVVNRVPVVGGVS